MVILGLFPLAILRIDCLSMHYAASAQQNRSVTLRDALKLSQHTGGVNNIIMCRCLFIVYWGYIGDNGKENGNYYLGPWASILASGLGLGFKVLGFRVEGLRDSSLLITRK